jgi:asparagine synthetase B (glutamine-hydrolysing)
MTAAAQAAHPAWQVSIAGEGPPAFDLTDAQGCCPAWRAESETGSCLFSGFLWNADELARDPAGSPQPLSSPAEIVLDRYRRWGEGLLDRLDGVFALVLWDARSRTLLCARDPLGHHPLFYAQAGGELIVSWDPRALRKHPRVSPDLDPVVIAEDLIHRLSDQEETHFRAVRRLPAAWALRWRRRRLETFRYWDPCPVGKPIQWLTPDEVAQFPELLRAAVERTTRFGPVGILLSGGFDSVSVAAWACEIARDAGRPMPQAFSLLFDGEFSEETTQRRVAEMLGLRHTCSRIRSYLDGKGLLGRLLEFGEHNPWPPLNQFSPAYIDLLHQARAQGCRAILTGDGGDEWLCVTPTYAADLIRAGQLDGLVRLVRTKLRSWKLPKLASLRSVLWTLGLRKVLRDWVWHHAPAVAAWRRRRLLPRALPPWLAPDPAVRRELERRYELLDRVYRQDTYYLADTRAGFSHPLTTLCAEENFFRDRLVGLPAFHPYLTRPLVDFLLRTPPELLNAGGRSKALVRNLVAQRFPKLGFERQKKLLATELNRDICRREGPLLWNELGQARALGALGVVDVPRFHAGFAEWLNADSLSVVHRVFHGANLEAWARRHI